MPKIVRLVLLVLFACLMFTPGASAQGLGNVRAAIQNSDCPDAVKRSLLDSVNNSQRIEDLQGTAIVATGPDGNIYVSCASASDIEDLFISIMVLLYIVVVLVLVFGIARSSITMMLAFDDQEKFQSGIKSLKTLGGSIAGAIASYAAIVFVLVGILGVGSDDPGSDWNIICQNQIVFDITFGDGITTC